MNGIMFIFSDLLQLTGCDPWQAQCIETLIHSCLWPGEHPVEKR